MDREIRHQRGGRHVANGVAAEQGAAEAFAFELDDVESRRFQRDADDLGRTRAFRLADGDRCGDIAAGEDGFVACLLAPAVGGCCRHRRRSSSSFWLRAALFC